MSRISLPIASLPNAHSDGFFVSAQPKTHSVLAAMIGAFRSSATSKKCRGIRQALFMIAMTFASLCAVSPAQAKIVTTTITGVVYSGIDEPGIFGSGSITGKNFTLVFTFDDTKGTQTVQNSVGTPCGSAINNTATSNPGTAALTIGSVTYTFGALPGFMATSTASRVIGGVPAIPLCGSFPGQLTYSVKDTSSSGGGYDSITAIISPANGTILTPDYYWEDSFSSSSLSSLQLASVVIETMGGGPEQGASISLLPVNITVDGLPAGSTPSSSSTTGLQFIPVPPCRVADTRNGTGSFAGPELSAGTSREFDIPQSACAIPSTAVAYSLNVTAVPNGPLGYLTMWPSGQTQPTVSTLNSDGRVKANAAIIPAGTNGGVSVYVTNPSNVILDIDGYFVPAGTASALAFYPLAPCRVVDTRNASGALGGPTLAAGTSRNFPLQSGGCSIPTDATAYSLNVTAIPKGSLGYLTMWPSGQTQPLVSTLNSPTGAVAANGAIVPAGSNGEVSVFVSNISDVVLDVNGYFAAPSANGLSLYTTTPCRVLDTRNSSGAFNGTLGVAVESSPCAPSSTAQAYVLNATVVPSGSLSYLTLWPAGETQPVVSTLNAGDGAVTSNMAIVPTMNGSIDAFSSNPTQLVLDISSYFAP